MCHRSPLNCLLGSRETQKGERTGAEIPAAYWPVDAPGAAALWEQKSPKKRHQEDRHLSLVSRVVWQASIFGVIKLNPKGCFLIFTAAMCANGVVGSGRPPGSPMVLVEILTFEMEPFQELITVKR